jgi:Protein of unknown function (DUF3592)
MQIVVPALVAGLMFSLVGALFAGIALHSLVRQRALLRNGITVAGVVIGLDEDEGLYAPIIHFITRAGEARQFIPSIHSSNCRYSVDQAVTLVYDSDNPATVAIPSYGGCFYSVFIGLGLMSLAAGFVLIAVGLGIIHSTPCNSSCDNSPSVMSGNGLASAFYFLFRHFSFFLL